MLDYHNRCFALCDADFQFDKHLVYSYALMWQEVEKSPGLH